MCAGLLLVHFAAAVSDVMLDSARPLLYPVLDTPSPLALQLSSQSSTRPVAQRASFPRVRDMSATCPLSQVVAERTHSQPQLATELQSLVLGFAGVVKVAAATFKGARRVAGSGPRRLAASSRQHRSLFVAVQAPSSVRLALALSSASPSPARSDCCQVPCRLS